MKVFKATRQDLTCNLGSGIFRYEVGKTYTAEECKCGKTGLHSCEYVLDCIGYYQMDGKNRFFLAEASGDIHEVGGDDTRVSSTELRLIRELNLQRIAYEAMCYMIEHPGRKWKREGTNHSVREDRVWMVKRGAMGIARGFEPMASGELGAVLGLVHEYNGEVDAAKLFTIDNILYHAGVTYQLTKEGVLIRREPGV